MTTLAIILLLIFLIGSGQYKTWERLQLSPDPDCDDTMDLREEKRIFCFIDLKGSTTIAEQIGHLRFASFLRDYYADITSALRNTEAEIYQYVGDEIVLSWPYETGLKNNNSVRCFYEMKAVIASLRDKYMDKYGFCPEFKAGLHGGKVTTTWIGVMKKEDVYVGDVLNTTSRIQENCNRLGQELLISGRLLKELTNLEGFEPCLIETTIPRGKTQVLELYGLKKVA